MYHVMNISLGSLYWLLEFTRDYWRLPEITGDYKRLLEITKDYWRITRDYWRLLDIPLVYEKDIHPYLRSFLFCCWQVVRNIVHKAVRQYARFSIHHSSYPLWIHSCNQLDYISSLHLRGESSLGVFQWIATKISSYLCPIHYNSVPISRLRKTDQAVIYTCPPEILHSKQEFSIGIYITSDEWTNCRWMS